MSLAIHRRIWAWFAHLILRQYLSPFVWLLVVISIAGYVTALSSGMNTFGILPPLVIVFLWLTAARMGATNAQQLLAMHPSEPTILFLRSFAQDETKITRPSDDQILHKALKKIGPTFTFGDPGRLLAHLGPPRLYIGYRDDWVELVTERMKQSKLVVLKVGNTPGVIQEARETLTRTSPEKILFWMSIFLNRRDLKKLYEEFSEAIVDQLPKPLPSSNDLENHRCIAFDESGTPELLANIRKPFIAWRWLIGPLARPIVTAYLGFRVRRALRPMAKRSKGEIL